MQAHLPADDEEYCNSLQRYSTLYRILLSRPYITEATMNQWNRIDLKLVNELGIKLTGIQKDKCWLQVSCRLLVEKHGQFKTCTDYNIQCRPLHHDAWEFTMKSDIAGFFYNTTGDFEYKITMADVFDNNVSNYYIQIFPTCQPQQQIQAFPLVIGPIKINPQTPPSPPKEGGLFLEWNTCDKIVSQDIFHSYCIQDNSFLIIKENWELGTPGKIWDSALVLSQMFSDKIKSDPTRFKGHRVLDLSAGTGCVGLLMALLYKKVYSQNKDNLPQITMTDLPEALHLIYQNRASNQLESYTNVQALAWGNYEDAQRVLRDGPIHTIIASDVLYEPASFSKLVQTLDWLSEDTPNTIDIFLGYKRRGLDIKDEKSFFDICAEKFTISTLPVNVENKLLTNEGWIVGGNFSNIFKDTGVNIYQLVRK